MGVGSGESKKEKATVKLTTLILILLAAFLVACSSSSTTGFFTGVWDGTWLSSGGGGGIIQANITHTGTVLDGSVTATETACFISGTLAGTATGTSSVVFSVTSPGKPTVQFSGTVDASGNILSGTYSVASSGSCTGDSGTWTATRREPQG